MKKSYTIPCSSLFRQAALDLAERRGVNVADLVRSILLAFPAEVINGQPDPGEPAAGDRETVTLKSGPSKGRPWRRKPRLQVRMTPGYPVPMLRKALAVALDLEKGALDVDLRPTGQSAAPSEAVAEELERLRAMVAALAFDPLPNGVEGRAEALHVLGFPPTARPDKTELRARFRILATIHHPDGDFGNHDRMAQLNEAMNYLKRYMTG
nr:J domain-containing protein [Magnetospira sp. QH-2]